MAQDFGTPVGSLPPEGAPKRNNTTLIIIIVVIAVLLVCCCLAIVILYFTGDQILKALDITSQIIPSKIFLI